MEMWKSVLRSNIIDEDCNKHKTSKQASQSTIKEEMIRRIWCKYGPTRNFILASPRQLWTSNIMSAMLTLYSHPKPLANVELTSKLRLVISTVSKI